MQKDRRDGNPTLRGKVMKDIDDTIKSSLTVKEFASKMKDMGYKFILVTETGKELKHPKLLLPNSDRCVRLDSLGPGYGLDDFYKRVIENTVIAADPFRELEEQSSTEKINR